MLIGEDKLADIAKDEEDGELSYYVNMSVARAPGAPKNAPLDAGERARVEKFLQAQMGPPAFRCGRARVKPIPRKCMSVRNSSARCRSMKTAPAIS